MQRLGLIDFMRGIAVINMIAFHLCYDYNVVFGDNYSWQFLLGVRAWQQCGVLLFILVSGMTFGIIKDAIVKNPENKTKVYGLINNGIKLILLGEIISFITRIFIPEEAISYGVLTFLGSAMLLSLLIENDKIRLLSTLKPSLGLGICYMAFLLTYNTQSGVIKLGALQLASWPRWLYAQNLAFIGFPGPSFVSADYVPLLPHIFMFWMGFYTYGLVVNRAPVLLSSCNFPKFNCLGKHSLIIYLVHQPLLFGIFTLLQKL